MLISTEQGDPSTKRIILRVCGWYLYFRLVFPGSDRIITLGIKDFVRKCTLHRKIMSTFAWDRLVQVTVCIFPCQSVF